MDLSSAIPQILLTPDAIDYYYDHPVDFVDDNFLAPIRAKGHKDARMSHQQKAGMNAVRDHYRVAIESGHGCHGIDTPIMMWDGTTKPVQDVVVGDCLRGGDGQTPRAVTELRRGREPMYRIRYHSGDSYVVNESHIMALVASQSHGSYRSGDRVCVSLREYLSWSNRKRRVYVGYKSSVSFGEKRLRINPYILGTWLADGTSESPSITTMDNEVVTAWFAEACVRGLDMRQTATRGAAATWSMRGGKGVKNTFWKDVLSYGLKGNKHIPHDYKTASMAQRLSLLAGILDGDGYLGAGGRGFEITQKRECLANDIVFLARSIGCHASVVPVQKRCCNNGVWGTYYRICISRNIEKIPVRVQRRKPAVEARQQRNNLHFGFTVEPLGEGDYYGFSLTGDGLYLLGDFTVTHNTGKSALFSWIGAWFLCTRHNTIGDLVKIPCIAPTFHQLYDVLWPEFKAWISQSRLAPMFELKADEIYVVGHKDSSFIRARSPKEADNLQGFHAAHLLWIADEAFGITSEASWQMIDGSFTQEDNRIVLGGQHTTVVGYCHDAFHKDKCRWMTLRFSSAESPLAKADYAEGIARKYGLNSDVYRIRVLGMEPLGNPDALIQLVEAEAARVREVKPAGVIRMGADCARFGDDLTVVTTAQGYHVFPQAIKEKTDTFAIYDLIISEARKYRQVTGYAGPIECRIDVTGGYGAGAYDLLLRNTTDGIVPIGINFSGEPDNDECADMTSAMWVSLRDQIKEMELPDDDNLINEIGARSFQIVNGKVKVEPKKEFKKDWDVSPDRSDSLVMCLYTKQWRRRVWEFCNRDCLKDINVGWHDRKQQQFHFLHYGAIVLGHDMSIHVLCALWDQRRGNLYIYDAWKTDDPSPANLVPVLATRMHMRDFFITKLLGSESIFEEKGARPVARLINNTLKTASLNHHRVRPATKYDKFGAIVDGGQMWKLKRIFVSKKVEGVVEQIQDWMIVKGEASAPSGYCEALCLILSELRVMKEIERVVKPEFRDYAKKEKVQETYRNVERKTLV